MYLLLGLGISSNALIKYFNQQNIKYLIFDDQKNPIDIDYSLITLIIKSGSFLNSHKIIQEAKKQKIEVVSDIELYYRVFQPSNLITVTGSNGKTTTVSIINNVLNSLIACGNIGNAIFDYPNQNDLIVEASSYMLEYIKNYHSHYVVLLNIFPTHLDHHINYVSYIRSKINLLKNSSKKDYIIYNYDDEIIRRIVTEYEGIKIPFSIKHIVDGIYLKNNILYYKTKKIIKIKHLKIVGEHNLYNIMGAIGVLMNYKKTSIFKIRKYIYNFTGVKHRLEYIGKIKDVKVYNDSKATNFLALSSALNCFKTNSVTLIVGGKMRKDNFSYLEKNLTCIRRVYCFGEAKEMFNSFFNSKKIITIKKHTINDVLDNILLDGSDILLFSPGCSSYDQFKNFEERGKKFQELILTNNEYNP